MGGVLEAPRWMTPGEPHARLCPQIKMGRHHVMLKSPLTSNVCLFCLETRLQVSAHSTFGCRAQGAAGRLLCPWCWGIGRDPRSCLCRSRALASRTNFWKRRRKSHKLDGREDGTFPSAKAPWLRPHGWLFSAPRARRTRTALWLSLCPAEGTAATTFLKREVRAQTSGRWRQRLC